jgi:hypothetical protein
MSSLTQSEILEFLRASVRHFQDNQDLGDQTDVVEIERMLVRRIEEIEGTLSRSSKSTHGEISSNLTQKCD